MLKSPILFILEQKRYTPCFSLIHTSTHTASSSDLHSYLNHFSVDPLPHFNSTVSHQHRPIQINVNQGSSLSKKKRKQLPWSFWFILSYILSNRRYFPWEVTPPFHLCHNTHRRLPHHPEQSQGMWFRAGLCCFRYYFLWKVIEALVLPKIPPDLGWNNNLSLGVLRERPSVLNAKSCIDCLGEKGKICLREHISLQL